MLLVKLMEGPARISQLADRIGLDVSTTSRKVAELEAAGLVARTLDPGDRRAALVSTTASAPTPWSAACARPATAHSAHMLAGWDDADRARLADLLERLVDDIHREGGLGGG